MITFLYNLFVLSIVLFTWRIIIEFAIGTEAGRQQLGKEEFNAQYKVVSNASIEFLKQFNPGIETVNDKAKKWAVMIVVLTALSPIFALGSLIAMFL